jgi:hypothetical protein
MEFYSLKVFIEQSSDIGFGKVDQLHKFQS